MELPISWPYENHNLIDGLRTSFCMLAALTFPLYWYIFRQKKVTSRQQISMKFERDIADNRPRHNKHTKHTKCELLSSDSMNLGVRKYHAWWGKPERSCYQESTVKKLYKVPSLLRSSSDTVSSHPNSHENIKNVQANQAPGSTHGRIDDKEGTIVNTRSPSSSGSR